MIFIFGKHKGRSFGDVLACDPQYIAWALEQEGFFDPIELAHLNELIKKEYKSVGHFLDRIESHREACWTHMEDFEDSYYVDQYDLF